MTDFWKTSVEDVGGKVTEDVLLKAVEDMRRQQDAYYREPPMPIVYPPNMAKEMCK